MELKNVEVHCNSILKLKTDAIVNAANSDLKEGGGVCGHIFAAAGSAKLAVECAKHGHCDTGSAVITSGCDLPNNKYIIHAVGPVYKDGKSGEAKLLYSCYRKALQLAESNGCRSVGFPLISAGIFGYPKDEAWRVAFEACRDHFTAKPDSKLSVVFVSNNRDTAEQGKEIFKAMP